MAYVILLINGLSKVKGRFVFRRDGISCLCSGWRDARHGPSASNYRPEVLHQPATGSELICRCSL